MQSLIVPILPGKFYQVQPCLVMTRCLHLAFTLLPKSNFPSQPLPLPHALPSAKASQSGKKIEVMLASTGMHASGKSPPETLGDLVSHGQTQAELHRHPVSLHPRLHFMKITQRHPVTGWCASRGQLPLVELEASLDLWLQVKATSRVQCLPAVPGWRDTKVIEP